MTLVGENNFDVTEFGFAGDRDLSFLKLVFYIGATYFWVKDAAGKDRIDLCMARTGEAEMSVV